VVRMAQLPGPAEYAAHDGTHHHPDVSGGWLRAAVFGAMDGLVTNIAIVAGVGGGGGERQLILLSGMAGLVAGAFSMALGEFASVETQNDAVSNEVEVEREEIRRHPGVEQAELAQMYEDIGLSSATARAVAAEVHADPDLAVKVHIVQELGVHPEDRPSPWTAAGSSFLCFAVGGIIPLIPYLLGFSSLALGLAVGGVGLFVLGALTSRFTRRAWAPAGLRQLAFGAVAAGATFLVGALIGVTAAG
jgi:VIT1/CCC1 family predicted Fe2+/Mn2+ transporter